MSDISVQINRNPAGGLDTNSDELNIAEGNYPDRVNVVRNNDGSYGSDTGELGTTVTSVVDVVSVQEQRLRVYIDEPFGYVRLVLKNTAGQTLRDSSLFCSPDVASNKQAIVTLVSAWGLGATFFNQAGNTPKYIDVQIGLSYSDWSMSVIAGASVPEAASIKTRIIREAISATGAGPLLLIGSKECNSLEFRCYTTAEETMVQGPAIQSIQNFGGQVLVEIPDHGLSDNESIIVARMVDAGAALNYEWTVTIVDANFFYLNFAVPTGIPTTPTSAYGGFIYLKPYGYSAVLAQRYNSDLDQYSYTVPLRSKRINWNTNHQVDIDVLFFNNVYALYPTDFYNRPYVMYFDEGLSNDCGIEAINPLGRYTYEQLYFQIIRHKDNNTARIDFVSQEQSGGSLPSCSVRYGVVLRTEEGQETEISDLSPLVRVYEPTYDIVTLSNVYGTLGATGKANKLIVTGIPSGIYQYVDLVAVIIAGQESNLTATEAYIVSSTQLGPDQTEITLTHSGNELDTRFFDLGKLNPVRQTPLRVKANVLGRNRLLEANYETSGRADLRDFAATFKYGIRQFRMYSDFGGENVYGFASPYSTQVGYQIYEWYRLFAVFEFVEGGVSDATFLFDARLVTQTEYTASFGTDDDYRFLSTNGTDRRDFSIDEFLVYDLGDQNRNLFQYYFQVFCPDWNFQIGGRPAKDVIRRVKICRAERIPEVQSMGYIRSSQLATNTPSVEVYSETSQLNGYVTGTTSNSFNNRAATYYAPDVFFGLSDGVFRLSDQLIVIGAPFEFVVDDAVTPGISINGRRQVFTGRIGSTVAFKYSNFQCQIIEEGGSAVFSDSSTGTTVSFSKAEYERFMSPGPVVITKGKSIASPVIVTDDPNGYSNPGNQLEHSAMSAIHFRRISNKYGETTFSSADVLYTNFDLTPDSQYVNVFGGDVYTQQTWLRPIYPFSGPVSGNALGFNIISQNRLNSQLRVYDPTNTTNLLYPFSAGGFDAWINSLVDSQVVKNAAYQEIRNQQYLPVFDPNALDRNKFPTRIRWSESTPNGAVRDFNTLFLPASFRDNPLTFGEIELLSIKQGELFTMQQLCYTREFLNNNGRLSTIEDGNVIIGDDSVLSRDGIRLTQLGTKHRWSYARGLNENGNDVHAWVNSDFFVILRSGADGSVNLTVRTMMDTFMRKYMRYVADKFTPASGQGIHSVWDNRSKRFIFTARGWKQMANWKDGRNYEIGAEVIEGNTYSIPQIWICRLNNEASESNRPGTSGGEGFWQKVSLRNSDYYSVWTLCFNEQVNRFTEFLEYYPKIYSRHFDRYFSQNPYEGEQTEHCRHRDGEPLVFYGKEHEGYSEHVLNYGEDINKKYIAVQVNSLYRPYKMEFLTQFINQNGIEDRFTRLVDSEFRPREGMMWSPIKMTLNQNGENNRRTKDMRGAWLRVKTFFKAREHQKINNIFVDVRMTNPNVKNP